MLSLSFGDSITDITIMSSSQCNKQHIYQLFVFSISENLDEEKKEREHLLALNQVIAQQVLQKRRSLPGKIFTIDFKTAAFQNNAQRCLLPVSLPVDLLLS